MERPAKRSVPMLSCRRKIVRGVTYWALGATLEGAGRGVGGERTNLIQRPSDHNF